MNGSGYFNLGPRSQITGHKYIKGFILFYPLSCPLGRRKLINFSLRMYNLFMKKIKHFLKN